MPEPVDAVALKFGICAYIVLMVAAHWTAPSFGGKMAIIFWIVADYTSRQVDELPDKFGHPECKGPNGEKHAYCDKMMTIHATFIALAFIAYFTAPSGAASAKTKAQ